MKSLLFIFALVSIPSTSVPLSTAEKALDEKSGAEPDPLDSFFQHVKPLQYKIPDLHCAKPLGKPCLPPSTECEDCSPVGKETPTEEEEFNEFSSFVRYGISLGGALAALGAVYLFIKATDMFSFMIKRTPSLGV